SLLLRRMSTGNVIDAGTIAEEARGHPLFIDELIRYVMAHGVGQAQAGVRLEGALWARIEALDAQARRILELVASAGAPVTQNVAAQAAGLASADFANWATVL